MANISRLGLGGYGVAIRGSFAGKEVQAFDEIKSFAKFGTLSGVTIAEVAGFNGPGRGSIRAGRDGTELSWRAPGSPAFGSKVKFVADATRTLIDGTDSDKWVRVDVTYSRLARSPGVATVRIRDKYGAGAGIEDLTAQEATDGKVSAKTITLSNEATNVGLVDSTNWLSPAAVAAGWEISYDNANWFTPVSDAEGQATIGTRTIAASGTALLFTRRTVGAAASSEPRGLVQIFTSWDDGDSGRAVAELRDLYRVFNATEFRVYRTLGGGKPQQDDDTPYATSATLPFEPADTFADGNWHVDGSEFNGVLESRFLRTDRIVVDGGAEAQTPPSQPFSQALVARAGGVTEIQAAYAATSDPAALQADTWLVWFTTDGSTPDPDVDPPDETITMQFTGSGHLAAAVSYLKLATGLPVQTPAQADGVTVKAVVRTERVSASAASANTAVGTVIVSTSGPGAPSGGESETDTGG